MREIDVFHGFSILGFHSQTPYPIVLSQFNSQPKYIIFEILSHINNPNILPNPHTNKYFPFQFPQRKKQYLSTFRNKLSSHFPPMNDA